MPLTKVLLGFLPEGEATQILGSDGNATPESLHERWSKAAEAVQNRTLPILETTPTELDPVLTSSSNFEMIKNRLANDSALPSSWSFKMVEIDKLVSLQKTVNHESAMELVKNVKDESDASSIVSLTLNATIPSGRILLSKDAVGRYLISSRSLNLGVLGFGMGEMQLPKTKESLKCAQLAFGELLSYVRVVRFQDRCILRDGYHRVYGLRAMGVLRTPCIFADARDLAEVGFAPALFPPEVVLSNNPPMVRDFFEISTDANLPGISRVFRLTVEQIDIPV